MCIQFIEPMLIVCSTQIWLDHLEDMWTGESQSVAESVLTHDGFFLRSFGINSMKLLSCRRVHWSAHMVFLFRWSDEKTCMMHSV